MGLDDADLRRLEQEIANNPQIGAVMRGTGGLRKMRFSYLRDRGKRGGARILYVDYVAHERVYLITAYPKSDKENITAAEREIYRSIIEQTNRELKERSK